MPIVQIDFETGTIVSADFLDRIQEVHAGLAWNCALQWSPGSTTVTVPAGTGNAAACLNIGGKMRLVESPLSITFSPSTFPTTGIYNIFATTSSNDNDRSFSLEARLTSAGNPSAAFFRNIGTVSWNASTSQIVYVQPTAGHEKHAHTHMSAGNDPLPADSVSSGMIQANAVTGAKILDGAVSTSKLPDATVTTAKIQDGAVATAKIADLAVTNAKLGSSAVTAAKIQDSTITNAKIANDTIQYAKLQPPEFATFSSTILTGGSNSYLVWDVTPTTPGYYMCSLWGNHQFSLTATGTYWGYIWIQAPAGTIVAAAGAPNYGQTGVNTDVSCSAFVNLSSGQKIQFFVGKVNDANLNNTTFRAAYYRIK